VLLCFSDADALIGISNGMPENELKMEKNILFNINI